MVAELTSSVPPPKCSKLGVNDYTFDCESETLFASLCLHLMCGNWQENVQLLNDAIHEYNHGVGRVDNMLWILQRENSLSLLLFSLVQLGLQVKAVSCGKMDDTRVLYLHQCLVSI